MLQPAADLQLVLNLTKIWCSEVFSLYIPGGPHRQSPRMIHCRISLEFSPSEHQGHPRRTLHPSRTGFFITSPTLRLALFSTKES
jgi:hypothetical protein